MATITLERVSKVYPNGFQAVNEVDLAVADGEFMVLAGPSWPTSASRCSSGCGKTTLLLMIAGLETITSGGAPWLPAVGAPAGRAGGSAVPGPLWRPRGRRGAAARAPLGRGWGRRGRGG